ncbi:putative ATPase [Chryseobacterium vietnamense]|uniref:AAA family ATPase n=1 Tax=Chryseobacterium vietnamense TaxID=866785 RepID=UPI00285E0A57|nr:AAA family ATPase [Chryseobacterium vietnamense]MDR6485715.1 putative ATPase [Chryseobacterium vietnamense]
MSEMNFLVTNKFGNYPENTKNTILLTWDDWNDYSYYTLFGVEYVNSKGKKCTVGAVRIAYIGQKKGIDQKKINIGDSFQTLDDTHFSVGTEDSYYETLNELPEEVKDFVLIGLNDIALNSDKLNLAIKEEVTTDSLMRDISYSTIVNQFKRIANGGARLSNYSFTYTSQYNQTSPIEFNIIAEQYPPTNIQIVIGSNGVGKSYLLNQMVNSVLQPNSNSNDGQFTFNTQYQSDKFSNVICVTFSAFDEYEFHNKFENKDIKYHFIGLKKMEVEKQHSINDFADNFISSINLILSSKRFFRWKSIITELESDPVFKNENLIEFIEKDYKTNDKAELRSKFTKLSSGHKIILLTITKLVELLQEKSLVFFDEPEIHLHPPLLSSFIRALSKLLLDRNAVCIMTTHSPIVLQEVPSSCVYKLSRMGAYSKFERPRLETFGENIGVLTNEVFGLEVTESGFYKILKELVQENYNYESALGKIDEQLGIEGRSILRSLFFDKER